MFHLVICRNYDEVSSEAFKVMKGVLDQKKDAVLGLATGSSPVGLYKKMIADHKASGRSYRDVSTWNLDEYVGLGKEDEQSYYTFMHENLFDAIDIKEENTHIENGLAADPDAEAKRYEAELKKVTVDLQVLGIGSDGHIAFNEPGTPFEAQTHVTDLTEQTISDNARFFDGDKSRVPTKALTQGLATIMRARKIVLIATGANKADAVYDMLKGPMTTDCPASILQKHNDVTVIVDEAAGARLR
ncbi:MAG: glucosamine-6-phosphate deaminase [Solobacterium sp.]|jgi:glucosamine-6-phosphate deaminase|nr:glucosamine-6-phosphate deaminase [Solobacterium sp.]MCH4048172.1 glucosamine-6-phosphate deaminase [Solobacterium sp.]MCH4074974.1 glucosamine-6-phosphate deaminase [Solobacterium sp.]MCI1313614.1 glucosamine-6-phosphate deaminase [Solobacterium sp.]MCI1345818.1 glucosamine-6-phosphate deaminase [Solobacterium sp.]